MSEISDAIQAKCLAFGDRVIKLDYLLEQASLKYDVRCQKYNRGSKQHQPSALSPQPSFRVLFTLLTLKWCVI